MWTTTRIIRSWAPAVGAAALAVGSLAAPAFAQDVLKIGVLGVMSGPAASWGLVNKYCAEATAQMYNEQGGVDIGGEKYKIEIVAVDDKNDPKLTVSGAERLIQQEGIRYIIGPNVDTTAASVRPIAEKSGALYIPYAFSKSLYTPPAGNAILGMIASWGIQKHVRGYCMLFLILETGMLGTFLALDFFLFYIFWEVMLLPMYFLIGVWGGPRREYAAIKFFLYTLLGSVFILIALLGFYFTNLRDFVDPVQVKAAVEQRMKETGETEAVARQRVEVHTFDLIALARAGKGALEYLGNDRKAAAVTSAPQLQEARKALGELEKAKAGENQVASARADVTMRGAPARGETGATR